MKEATGTSTVTLGLAPSGVSLLTGALATFRASHPDAEVRIVGGPFGALKRALREGKIDIGVALLPADQRNPSLKSRPLFRAEPVIVGRRGHPLAKATSLDDLALATWAAPWNAEEGPSFGQSGTIRELFSLNHLPFPRSFVRCNEPVALLTLLMQTDAIGVLDRWQLERGPAAGLLQPFKLRARLPSFTVYAFHRADAPQAPAAMAMVAAFRNEAKKLMASGRRRTG